MMKTDSSKNELLIYICICNEWLFFYFSVIKFTWLVKHLFKVAKGILKKETKYVDTNIHIETQSQNTSLYGRCWKV